MYSMHDVSDVWVASVSQPVIQPLQGAFRPPLALVKSSWLPKIQNTEDSWNLMKTPDSLNSHWFSKT